MVKALIAENLSLQLDGHTVLNEINLELEASSVTAVCGGALSGTEYIEKLLLHLFDTQNYKLRGRLLINGVETDLLNQEDMRFIRMLDIGLLHEDVSSDFAKGLNVKSYLLAPFGEKFSKSKREIINNSKYVLKTFGIERLESFFTKRVSSLSDEQRLALYFTAAVAANPSLLIIKAPAKINSDSLDNIYSNIIKICKIKSITVLFITEDIAFANKFCERIIVMKKGSIVDDTSKDVLSDEYSRFLATKEFEPFSKTQPAEEIVLSAKLKDCEFLLHRFEILGIKTKDTKILKSLCGFKKSSYVLLGDKKLSSVSANLRRIYPLSYESLSSFPKNRTVRMILDSYARVCKPRNKTGRNLIVHNSLTNASLDTGIIDRKVASLSEYDGIKLALACAVCSNAKILLVSGIEKFSSPLMQHEILNAIMNVCKNLETSAIILSGDEKILNSIANRIILI